MNIEGTYTLQALKEEVWEYLLNPEILRATVPGIESITPVDANSYDITVAINYTSLEGSYRGRVTFSEQHYPYHYRLTIERVDEQGAFSSSGNVSLSTRGNTTVIAYKGSLSTGKSRAQLSQSMIKGTVKLFIQQYFLALAERLQNEQHRHSMTNGATSYDLIIKPAKKASGEITIETNQEYGERANARPTIYSRIVSLLHLGADDPAHELQWEQRLRRASVISSLLFLVWVGTRLPRRRQTSQD